MVQTVARKRQRWIHYIKRTWMIYLMLLLPIIYFTVFRYVPMTNIVIAFKDYSIFQGVWKSPWVGLKWFSQAFAERDFQLALRNTIMLNLLDLAVGFPAPVILAILLNELAFKKFKRLTQTIVYLPHFLSWIIISGLSLQLLAPNTGLVNMILAQMGLPPINFLMEPLPWVVTYICWGLWYSAGWGTIIYLAAITGISPELYEAAEVDGASRIRKIWHITLPGLRPTIITLLIMNLGRILSNEFDRPWSMRNQLVTEVADMISTYVYRVGIRSSNFSLAAAVGLFQSVVCVIFLLAANAIAEKFGERGIW